jgi:GntR family transcriptional regulator
MTSFVDDFEIHDVELEDQLLSKEVVQASIPLGEKLHLGPELKIIKIERLRIADKTPFVLEQQYYDYAEFAPLLEMDIRGSMYELLVERFGADLHHSIQTLRAVMPTQEIAHRLKISASIPCMFLESIAYTAEDRPLEVLRSYYRGDRYLFQVESSQYRRELSPLSKLGAA